MGRPGHKLCVIPQSGPRGGIRKGKGMNIQNISQNLLNKKEKGEAVFCAIQMSTLGDCVLMAQLCVEAPSQTMTYSNSVHQRIRKNKNTLQKRWCVLHRACDSEGTYDLISLDGTKYMTITITKESRDRLM